MLLIISKASDSMLQNRKHHILLLQGIMQEFIKNTPKSKIQDGKPDN